MDYLNLKKKTKINFVLQEKKIYLIHKKIVNSI